LCTYRTAAPPAHSLPSAQKGGTHPERVIPVLRNTPEESDGAGVIPGFNGGLTGWEAGITPFLLFSDGNVDTILTVLTKRGDLKAAGTGVSHLKK